MVGKDIQDSSPKGILSSALHLVHPLISKGMKTVLQTLQRKSLSQLHRKHSLAEGIFPLQLFQHCRKSGHQHSLFLLHQLPKALTSLSTDIVSSGICLIKKVVLRRKKQAILRKYFPVLQNLLCPLLRLTKVKNPFSPKTKSQKGL